MYNIPSVQGIKSVTAVSATTFIGRRHIVLVNSGAKTAFLRFNGPLAVVTDFPLGSGKSVTLDCDLGSEIYSVSAICAGAEVTTIDYLAWN